MDAIAHTVETYRAAVLGLVRPLAAERVQVAAAVGRVLAEQTIARTPVPRFDNAAMDGYAVREADVEGTTPGRPASLVVTACAPAGHRHGRLVVGPGEAVQIMTGAPIPEGADRVIPVEESSTGSFVDRGKVLLWDAGKTHIRRTGEDIAAGDPLLSAGDELTARGLALLAATGHEEVLVHRRPRVAVISSGDELSAQSAGAIPDSNAVYLRAAVESLGGIVSSCRLAADDPISVARVLDAAACEADLIVSTGGLGAGTRDLLGRMAQATLGGILARVAMRPGRPQALGTWSGVPWLALPGTPTAAFVSFEAFVRPALNRLSGRPVSAGPAAETVSEGWSGSPGAVRFVPLDVSDSPGGLSIRPMGHPGRAAHALSAMFAAPLIGVVGAETGDVRAGQLLRVIEPA
ncbi:gephyrin-like molybdotransferase Glp [Leifsonia sp. fls2-241-R2A-40a]|uniref:molybdopterin molybdotransferase MoeA n=1 Tax=Leifsonia sp. fls2-241-R2A-40a TaxID=3040290 RepID=UPI0025506947|nr:gephyrin-like molybdotransferase Glp [Leifsonia sp. fls2-241-R2A-40a]